ncbi:MULTISPECIES: hypothetical protein [unclassified Cupriavidus]|uniref:hypothetical protein n=1 Tax=unclassified Cupriavidus TaxID=2640874 RepID=UPI001C0039FE|nr:MULTISPECIES: hypothetical protein [unclassified Cupriavidus]MCA3186232.1 hypothetical protein [Cupriavidus sp.]MCA3189147.1 hypothetical protein [Cupriavidus sp.]MCA3198867.1 hypothetical protein [Cupriavidus sp.]MCA3201611.1 hypothetical protein [Cupriavidus sp.]MCA3233125.1 hypothetical protein [Cupriavidus sp.]
MRVTSLRGQQAVARRGFTRPLKEGESVCIPAFESIDIHLAGGVFAPSRCQIDLADTPIAGLHTVPFPSANAARIDYLRELISGTVFHNPQQTLNAQAVAKSLDTTPKRIQSALFMQGAAFTQLCRTQRLMRALFDAVQFNVSVADLTSRVGWVDPRDLETSFYDWFGVSLQTVSRLREDCL